MTQRGSRLQPADERGNKLIKRCNFVKRCNYWLFISLPFLELQGLVNMTLLITKRIILLFLTELMRYMSRKSIETDVKRKF